jgi:hypothetical protein
MTNSSSRSSNSNIKFQRRYEENGLQNQNQMRKQKGKGKLHTMQNLTSRTMAKFGIKRLLATQLILDTSTMTAAFIQSLEITAVVLGTERSQSQHLDSIEEFKLDEIDCIMSGSSRDDETRWKRRERLGEHLLDFVWGAEFPFIFLALDFFGGAAGGFLRYIFVLL